MPKSGLGKDKTICVRCTRNFAANTRCFTGLRYIYRKYQTNMAILYDIAYCTIILFVPVLAFLEFDQWRISRFSNTWWREKLTKQDIRQDELEARIRALEKDSNTSK